MEKIRVLLQKHRETVSYVFWGAMTTAVNYAVYLLLRQFQVYYAYANVAAWAAGVMVRSLDKSVLSKSSASI